MFVHETRGFVREYHNSRTLRLRIKQQNKVNIPLPWAMDTNRNILAAAVLIHRFCSTNRQSKVSYLYEFSINQLQKISRMKIAVVGCLHGMMDSMYHEINNSDPKVDLVLVCGDCQTIRHYDDLICLSVPDKYKKIGDFHEYYSGKKKVPVLTIFVGGNHEASNYLMTLPYGGWVCENFYYLGYAGVINFKGLRIAGVSGIYNHWNHNRGRYETMPLNQDTIKSVYHTRQLDIFRLQLLCKRANQNPIDMFLSHDWPRRVYDYGNKNQLMKFKPGFRKDIESRDGLGNPMTESLLKQLKPKRWFAAHLHCKFFATITHNNGLRTEFLSLNKIENRRNYMEIIDVTPTRDYDNSDNELYYDEEWLAILRKTKELESDSKEKVICPRIDDESGKRYIVTDQEIEETIDLMNKHRDGFRVARNFRMVEPVIYNRPTTIPTSLDHSRVRFYPNYQTEELRARLKLVDDDIEILSNESSKDAKSEDTNKLTPSQEGREHDIINNNVKSRVEVKQENSIKQEHDIKKEHEIKQEQPVKLECTVKQEHPIKQENQVGQELPIKREFAMSGQKVKQERDSESNLESPMKRMAVEIDEDGCLPFYIDKKGDK